MNTRDVVRDMYVVIATPQTRTPGSVVHQSGRQERNEHAGMRGGLTLASTTTVNSQSSQHGNYSLKSLGDVASTVVVPHRLAQPYPIKKRQELHA